MRYQLRYTPKCDEYNARIAPASSKMSLAVVSASHHPSARGRAAYARGAIVRRLVVGGDPRVRLAIFA